jgi:hypothetical protein
MKNICLIVISLLIFSCAKEELNVNIKMPSTPVLTVQSRWGVVNGSYIRITDINDRHNNIIATLRKGDIVEVLSKETEKESEDNIYWYEVSKGEIYGVVPEDQLDLYDSKAKAQNASGQL